MKLAAPSLKVTTDQREALQRISRSHSLPHRSVLQAKALLMSGDGAAIYEVASKFDVSSNAVRRWRRRDRARTGSLFLVGRGHGR